MFLTAKILSYKYLYLFTFLARKLTPFPVIPVKHVQNNLSKRVIYTIPHKCIKFYRYYIKNINMVPFLVLELYVYNGYAWRYKRMGRRSYEL